MSTKRGAWLVTRLYRCGFSVQSRSRYQTLQVLGTSLCLFLQDAHQHSSHQEVSCVQLHVDTSKDFHTCTLREIKNRSGIDMSVNGYEKASTPKQVKYYHVVVITNLPFYKCPEHSEDDTVQFMVCIWNWISVVYTRSSPHSISPILMT